MKKFLFLILFVCFNLNVVYAHGFGAHAKHYETLVALNLPGSYLDIITDSRFKPYFIYGSMFPDIQFAVNYKQVLSNIYQKIRNVKLYQISELNINENAFEGLTYEIDLDEIPNLDLVQFVFGFDTHNENYALQFAEYLFTESAQLSSNVMTLGTGNEQLGQQIAFALGYYAHIAEDIAAHNFLIPKITAQLNLGDLELVKNNSTFNEDPNAQMEGIIEALIDHHFGDNYLVAQTVYNNIWVRIGQLEPSVPLVIYDGMGYPNSQYWGLGNPMFDFFLNTVNQFLVNNPGAKTNDPVGLPGLLDLADIFRFVNRFYPAVVGKPFNGFQRIDQVLADWISNHLDLSDAANAWGITLGIATGGFLGLMNVINFNVEYFAGIAYPSILSDITSSLLDDSRSMISLMLSDINRSDQLVQSYPDKININSYNQLKNNGLFTNGYALLQNAWNEYKELGCRIYAEVGPTGSTQNWYYNWAPWRKQTMTWGVYSSLNNLLPEIYESNPNVAVYDSYFQIGPIVVQGPQAPSVFQTYSTARINIDLFNTSNVNPQNLNLVVKKDHNSTDYENDGFIGSTGLFTLDQNPISYGSVNRLTKHLDFPVSINDLSTNKGYYYELKNSASNKPIFTSSFEQYQNRLALSSNYYQLYDTYKKWPYSLGAARNLYTVVFSSPKVEGVYSSGSYLINGISASSILEEEGALILLEAVPGQPNEKFFKWSDGNTNNPRQYKVQNVNNIYAIMKKAQLSNDQNAYANNSQRKFVRTLDGHLHCVYESMNRIWYERSTNNGQTWDLMNNGKPLSNQDSKLPAIDYRPKFPGSGVAFGDVGIVFQEKNGEAYKIKFYGFGPNFGTGYPDPNPIELYSTSVYPYTFDANPAIAWQHNGDLVVVWNNYYDGVSKKNIFSYWFGSITPHGVLFFERNIIGSTNGIADYPSIAVNSSNDIFHLAWQENGQDICYAQFKRVWQGAYQVLQQTTIKSIVSAGDGFPKNYHPSIISVGGADNFTARLCWIGDRRADESPIFIEGNQKTVVFTATDNPGRYWTFGSNVNSVNINKCDDRYAISWAQGNDEQIQFTDSRTLSSPFYSLNIKGKDVQLSNGKTESTMYALAFNTKVQPYYMQTERVYTNPKPIYADEKREGVVSEEQAQVYFNVGDVVVDEKKIGFVEIPDTASVTNQQTANQYLVSEPFSLNDNSEFFYSVKYGLTDSLSALSMLNGTKSLTFKVELLDAQTNEILGVFDDVTYDQGNLIPFEKIDYQVITDGIGSRIVKLRLTISCNFNPSYSVAEKYDTETGLAKKQYKQMSYKGSLVITEYALYQNYPNPFNPATTINYHIKEDGLVTLKLYDILGAEVKTLLNEEKIRGRYSYNFNASDLASGVYIYQLRVNDFVSSKKLLLMK